MYSYVPKEVARLKRGRCQEAMEVVKYYLKRNYGLNPQIVLVGSGRALLVTKWDNEPFDFDYNLLFSSLPEKYLKDPGLLKNTLRIALDHVLRNHGFSYGQDSTSVLSYSDKAYGPHEFTLDIGIILRGHGGNFNRLIHVKDNPNQYVWNEVKKTGPALKRAEEIKQAGKWTLLHKRYLDLKNHYGQNPDHPSFLVFAEAVNSVWQTLEMKKRSKRKRHHVSGNTLSQEQLDHHANQCNPNNAAYLAAQK